MGEERAREQVMKIPRALAVVFGVTLLAVTLLIGARLTAQTAGPTLASAETLTARGGRVSWSPSGDLIAFDRRGADGYYDLFVMRRDGSDVRCLTDRPGKVPQENNGQPAWHPLGTYLVFQSQDPRLGRGARGDRLSEPGAGLHNNLWVTNANGTGFWQLTRVERGGGVLHPHFSPDGRKLLWAERAAPTRESRAGQWSLMLADFSVDSGTARLSNVRSLRPRDLQFYESHGFSPDGRKIIYSAAPRENEYFDLEIDVMDLATRRADRLTQNNEWDEHAHFSPNGRFILWASSEGIAQPKETRELRLDYWIMNADGSGKHRLTAFNDRGASEHLPGRIVASDLDWSPDGRAIVAYVQQFTLEGREPAHVERMMILKLR